MAKPYDSLKLILWEALFQAAQGKGKERHANDGEPFEKQPILEITRRLGVGYPLGQAVKKIYEGQKLPAAQAEQEFLGAINYVAAAIIRIRESNGKCGEE